MCNQTHAIRKQIETPVVDRIKPGETIETLYDTVEVGQGDTSIAFFDGNASGDKTDSNYQTNPLPGDYPRKIYGATLNSTLGSIRSTDLSNVDPDQILNALRRARLEFLADSDESLLLRVHLDEVMNLDEAAITRFEDSTAGTVYHTLELPASKPQLFQNPFQLGTNQTFQANIEVKDGSGFPDPANYIGQNFALRLDLITVKPE